MKAKIDNEAFKRFINLCDVSGKAAEGRPVSYYEAIILEANKEDSNIHCQAMYMSIQYIAHSVLAAIEEDGLVAFKIEHAQSAIKDLVGTTLVLSTSKEGLRVDDGENYSIIPLMKLEDSEVAMSRKRALEFAPCIDCDDKTFYFCVPTSDGKYTRIPYSTAVTVKAEDMKAAMTRLSFLKSIYYHVYTNDDKLFVELLQAKKGRAGKKFRKVTPEKVEGDVEMDVEFKEVIDPVINTIGKGTIIIYSMDQTNPEYKDIPCLIYYETEKIHATFIVTLKGDVQKKEEKEKPEKEKKSEKKPKKEAKKEDKKEDKKGKVTKKETPTKKKGKKMSEEEFDEEDEDLEEEEEEEEDFDEDDDDDE